MNPTEVLFRRRNVRAFIKADPVYVSFTRRVKTPSPAGGWTWVDSDPVAPQEGRLVPSKRRYADMTVNTEAGQVVLWPYLLLGYHDMDIQEGDHFVLNGQAYEVKSIEPDREERTVAAVDFFGG